MSDIDPITGETQSEYRDKLVREKSASSWEHEDLAQIKVKVLRGHTDSVVRCEFLADGTRVLTASWDKSVRMWDTDSAACVHTYPDLHSKYISSTSLSPCGKRFLTCGWDKRVCVWDIETGGLIWSGVHGGVITTAAFSHAGRYVVSGSDLDNSVKLWDAETGELIYHIPDLHTGTITYVMFTPRDDRLITCSTDKSVKFWDTISQTNTITLQDHENAVTHCCLTHDERRFATCSWDKTIRIYDIATGSYRSTGPHVFSKGHDGSVSSCDFSLDGSLLASCAYDKSIVLWDTEDNILKIKLQGHSDWIEDIKFSPDQKWILSCSKDQTARLWNVEEADSIPIVVENRMLQGVTMQKCNSCGKPFSLTTLDGRLDPADFICVFCRMKRGPQLPSIPDALP